MILKLIQIIFFIIVIYVLINFIKLVFKVGKSASEINRKIDEMNKNKRSGSSAKRNNRQKDGVIELDKNQYKVE